MWRGYKICGLGIYFKKTSMPLCLVFWTPFYQNRSKKGAMKFPLSTKKFYLIAICFKHPYIGSFHRVWFTYHMAHEHKYVYIVWKFLECDTFTCHLFWGGDLQTGHVWSTCNICFMKRLWIHRFNSLTPSNLYNV